MEGKYPNYVKDWRRHKGLSQKELVARLIELAGEGTPDDPELRIPTTEASLSRIENAKQNFNMATLQALAKALDVDEPGWLLDRKPGPGAQVIYLWDHLSIGDQEKARAVLEAMFGTAP
jgi:transcriptional regulator with XRE-family HTH domain